MVSLKLPHIRVKAPMLCSDCERNTNHKTEVMQFKKLNFFIELKKTFDMILKVS